MSDARTRASGRWSLGSAGAAARAGACLAVLAGVGLVGWAAWERPGMGLADVVGETAVWAERAQVAGWLATAAAAGVACWRQRARRGLLLGLWLAAAGLLAALRELDLHVVLNPGNIHLVGLRPEQAVRFRLDWWTDRAVPAGLKLVWGAVLLLIPAAVVAPFALARYPWWRMLVRREAFVWLIGAGLGCIAAGYVADDVLGRPLKRAGVSVTVAEEGLELVGVAMVLCAAVLLAAKRVRMEARAAAG